MLNRLRWLVALVLLPLSVAVAQAPASWSPVGTASIGDLAVNATGAMWAIQFDRTSSVDKPVLKWVGNAFVAQPWTAVRIAVDPQGSPWTVSSTGVLANLPAGSSQWTTASLKASDVAVGADGSVWAIATDQNIYRLTNGQWTQVSGAAVRISVDPRGNAWVVNGGGAIWRFDGKAFQYVAGSAKDISIGSDGSVFIVSTKAVTGGFEILQWTGSGWTAIPGAGGVVIAAGQKLYIGLHGADGTKLYATDYAHPATSPGTVSIAIPVYTQPITPPTSQPSGPTLGQPVTIAIQGKLVESLPATPPAPKETPLTIGGLAMPVAAQPIEGTLICPKIGPNYNLAKGCALVGEAALYLGKKASNACKTGEFGDPQNGGECWTCPVDYVRNVSPVSSKDACWKPVGERLSAATSVGKIGCKTGFFNDPIYGCFQCPSGYYRTLDNVTWGTACAQSITGPFKFATSGGKPTLACAAPSFSDPIKGGTCWTCPANYRRTLNPVDGDKACAQTYDTQYSVATQMSGCSMAPSQVGYGTPFYDPRNGGECWTCPIPLLRAGGSPVNAPDRGLLAACNAGGDTNRIVWQLSQYPEPGIYGFMPGLLKMAFADPKAVDAFIAKRAGNDPTRKLEIWRSMVADPGSSAEVKALVFSALLAAAEQPNPSPEARISLEFFEKYAHARRVFVAAEAWRMFDQWQAVDGYNAYTAARNGMGIGGMQQVSTDVIGKAGADYKAYAWSGAVPDSAGLEFIAAAATLAGVAQSRTGTTLNTTMRLPFTTEQYLAPVFKALDKGFDKIGEAGENMAANTLKLDVLEAGESLARGAKGAGVAVILVESAVSLGLTIAEYIEKEKQAAEYQKIVAEADEPIKVKEVLESNNDDDRRSLLLYWSLATSPYSANAKLSQGRISGASLCQSDLWKLQCAQAKGTIASALNLATAMMATGN